MNTDIQVISELLLEAKAFKLYKALVLQINKDFNLAGVPDVQVVESISPKDLEKELLEIIKNLINNDFNTFLSFLYRIDLPESKIKNLPELPFDQFVSQVVLLILKREWMKVWFKDKYS